MLTQKLTGCFGDGAFLLRLRGVVRDKTGLAAGTVIDHNLEERARALLVILSPQRGIILEHTVFASFICVN